MLGRVRVSDQGEEEGEFSGVEKDGRKYTDVTFSCVFSARKCVFSLSLDHNTQHTQHHSNTTICLPQMHSLVWNRSLCDVDHHLDCFGQRRRIQPKDGSSREKTRRLSLCRHCTVEERQVCVWVYLCFTYPSTNRTEWRTSYYSCVVEYDGILSLFRYIILLFTVIAIIVAYSWIILLRRFARPLV
jgi:hypothetical protein